MEPLTARAVGLPEASGVSAACQLVNALNDKQVLVVLDNGEHVIEACARLVDQLRAACPAVTVMTTSRERLPNKRQLAETELPLAKVVAYCIQKRIR